MNVATIFLLCVLSTNVGYLTPNQTCTTKDAQKANTGAQRPNANPNWWMGTPQSQTTTRMPSGRNPNDFPTLQTFPTVYAQPTDKPSVPTIVNGQKALPVSTCGNSA